MFVNNLMGKTTPGLINLIKRYWKITPKKRGLLFGFVSTGVFVIALRLLEPWPLKFVFDKIVAFSTHDNSGDLNTSHFLIIAALMVILIAGLRIITTVVHSHLMQSITNRLCQTLRNRIFSHIQILPIVQHENTVQKFSNLNNDIKQVQESLSQFAVPFAMNLLTLGSMLIVLLIINWQLTVFSIITVPAIWLIGVKTAQLLYRIKLNKNQRAKPALLGPPLYDDDMIDKIPTLTQEQPFNESYIETSSERIKKFLKSLKSSLGVEATSDILITVATALVLWYGAIQILNKTLTAGELLIFFAYLHFAFKPLRKFKLFQQKLHITNKVSQKIFDTLESDKLIQDLPNAIPLFSFQGALRFENVTVSNEYGENVVNNFNFYVQPDKLLPW